MGAIGIVAPITVHDLTNATIHIVKPLSPLPLTLFTIPLPACCPSLLSPFQGGSKPRLVGSRGKGQVRCAQRLLLLSFGRLLVPALCISRRPSSAFARLLSSRAQARFAMVRRNRPGKIQSFMSSLWYCYLSWHECVSPFSIVSCTRSSEPHAFLAPSNRS